MPVALVTGASEGLGRAIALDLAAAGWDLVIDARRPGPLAAAAAEARALGVRVEALAGDIVDARHRREIVAAARGFGRLDLLVANAATLGPTPLPTIADVDLDELASTFTVNVVAQVGLLQEALSLLLASQGTVVAITSDAAVEGYEGWGAYGASKAAFEQIANVLASEQPRLRVLRFDPGDMRTSMHQAAFPGEDISDRPLPETVPPALRALLTDRNGSGRYRATDLATDLAGATS